MKKSKKTAIAGIFTALCVVVLFVGSLFQSLDLSAAAFASMIIVVVLTELGRNWALGVYGASAIISLLLLPYKSPALIFAVFAGLYPLAKQFLNRITPMWLSYLARIVFFNIILVILVFAASKLLFLEEFFFNFKAVIFLLSNITFVLYDFALERIVMYYIIKIRPTIFKRR